jgi:hypothetical protein
VPSAWLRPRGLAALDDLADPIHGLNQPLAVALLLESWNKLLVEHPAAQGIRQNRFQAIPDLDAGFAVLDGHQEHDPVVLPLLADAPFLEQLVGEVVDLAPLQRLEDDHGELGPGLPPQFRRAGLQGGTIGRTQDPREIAHAPLPLRLKLLEEGVRGDGRRGCRRGNPRRKASAEENRERKWGGESHGLGQGAVFRGHGSVRGGPETEPTAAHCAAPPPAVQAPVGPAGLL